MSIESDPEKYKDFVKELTELSKKHKVKIAGCGCCTSPFLISLDQKEIDTGQYYLHDPKASSELEWIER